MNRIIKLLGKVFLAVLIVMIAAIVMVVAGYLVDIEWLKGIGFGLALAGIAALLTLLLMRVTQQVVSVRRAVKQAYDRQLKLADYLDNRVKERVDSASRTISGGAVQTFERDPNHGYGVDYEYSRRQRVRTPYLHTFALTTRSLRIRDSLSLAASRGRWREGDLLQFFRLEVAGLLTEQAKKAHHQNLEHRNLIRFAGVLLNQLGRPTDLQDADNIYRYIIRAWGHKVMPHIDRLLAAEAALELNSYTQVEEIFALYGLEEEHLQKQLMTANGIALKSDFERYSKSWVDAVNEVYSSAGLAQISLSGVPDGSSTTLYDQLDALTPHRIIDGPKVTILLPTFKADHKIYTAIRSLLKQTWQNIEILIIDDGSHDDSRNLLSQIAKLDDRIKLILLDKNRGAYIARNAGLEHATGQFITVHDDDDWSHPQKIEFQVRDLLENPEKVGNWSKHVRTTEELFFKRLNNNPTVTQFNYSSIMFRKEIVDAIGGWNNVNRSGDSEFRARIQSYSGQSLQSPVDEPMSFTRTGGSSLTQGEMSRGYLDSGRLFYMQVFQEAHRRAREMDNWTPAIAKVPAGVPENLKDGQRNMPLGHFDVIYGTDFRFPGGNSSLAIAEINAMLNQGKRVGIIQLDSPVNAPRNPLAKSVLELLGRDHEKLSVLSLRDLAETDLFIVRNPSVVQFADQLETQISAKNVVLIVNSTPVLSDGTGQVYSLTDVVQNLEGLFKTVPKLVAESEITRQLATWLGDGARFDAGYWPGMVDTERFGFVPRKAASERKPVTGRHSRDSRLKWPEDLATFREVYVQPEAFRTSILGGLKEVKPMLEEEDLESLEVFEFGAMDPEIFLEKLDFWIFFPSERQKESFGMSVAEAMASGLVVILPETMKSTFQEGAIYCEPSEVVATVERFWASPELYEQQSVLARQVCLERFSAAATLDRIDQYRNVADDSSS